jgi:hypothetical protein
VTMKEYRFFSLQSLDSRVRSHSSPRGMPKPHSRRGWRTVSPQVRMVSIVLAYQGN